MKEDIVKKPRIKILEIIYIIITIYKVYLIIGIWSPVVVFYVYVGGRIHKGKEVDLNEKKSQMSLL